MSEPAKGRLERALGFSLLAVFSGSFITFFAAMFIGSDSLFSTGVTALILSGVAIDLFFDLTASGAEEARGRSRRRWLAIGEVATVSGWVVFAWSSWQGVAFWAAAAIGSSVVVAACRLLRRRLGLPLPQAWEKPPEVTVGNARRFWTDRGLRAKWWLLVAFQLCGYGAALMLGVLVAGETPAGAFGVTVLVLVPVVLVSWYLHKRWQLPFISALPPRPEPEPQDVPATVAFRPHGSNALLVLLAPSFVFVLFGAIAVALGREGPEPAFGNGTTAVVVVAAAAAVALSIAAYVRVRRMLLEVGEEGVRIVNFFGGSVFARWQDIARVEPSGPWARAGLAMAVAAVADVPDEFISGRGMRIRLDETHSLRVEVTAFTDPKRDARFQGVVVALRREGAVHGVPVLV
jgi:hypothetical protein